MNKDLQCGFGCTSDINCSNECPICIDGQVSFNFRQTTGMANMLISMNYSATRNGIVQGAKNMQATCESRQLATDALVCQRKVYMKA